MTGQDWKPNSAPPAKTEPQPTSIPAAISEPQTSSDFFSLAKEIETQGDVVRNLKSNKATKETITKEVAKLLELKKEYKSKTGKEWTPAAVFAAKKAEIMSAPQNKISSNIEQQIIEQGEKVRDLKAKKVDKVTIQKEVDALLALKAEYKKVHGKDYAPAGAGAREAKPKTPKVENAKPANKPAKKTEKESASKEVDGFKTGTRLGLEAKKSENLSDWYSQVITKAEMIDYYDVSGCYILLPWSYSIWDVIKDFLDREIKKLGVQNCYFPIFVSKAALEREKTHIADFAPEVAWVTKSGDSDLAEHIAIRPTSETVMYPAYAKRLKSHRDLPLKLNQWNNVVVSN